jgi:hypothetical protein
MTDWDQFIRDGVSIIACVDGHDEFLDVLEKLIVSVSPETRFGPRRKINPHHHCSITPCTRLTGITVTRVLMNQAGSYTSESRESIPGRVCQLTWLLVEV